MVRLLVCLVCLLSVGSSNLSAQIPRSLYVGMGLDDAISRVDLTDYTVHPNIIPVDDMPNQILIEGDTAYVVCSGDDDICVVDLEQEEVISRIYCIPGSNPFYMVLYQDSLIYVSNFRLHSVSKISLSSGTLLDEIGVGLSPEGMLLMGEKLYVANTGWDPELFIYQPGSVSVIDLTEDTVMATISTPLNPQYLDLDPQGEVNVLCTGDWFSTFGWVYVIDPQTNTPVDSMYTGGSPGHIRVGPSGIGHLAAGGWWIEGYIYTVNTLTEEVLHGSDDPIITAPGVMDVLEDNWGWIYCSNQLVEVDRVTMFENDYTSYRTFHFPDSSGPQCLAVYEVGDMIEVTAGSDTAGVPGDSLIISFLINNLGGMQDVYDISIADSLGWEIFPSNFFLTVEVDQDTLVSIRVVIPPSASGGEVDWVKLSAVSQSNPEMDADDFLIITVTEPILQFIRADANADMNVQMGDAIYTLKYLYVPGSEPPPCMKAADANDDGTIAMSDAIYTLKYLYVPGSPEPPTPFPDCGVDPTEDELDCQSHPCMGSSTISTSINRFGGTLRIGDAKINDGVIIVPVYLTNTEPLSAFAYTVNYDSDLLASVSVENDGLVTETFDFFSGRPNDGSITVGSLVSLTMKSTLSPGAHHITDIIFRLEEDCPTRDAILQFCEVELLNVEGKTMTSGAMNGTVRVPAKIAKVFALKQNTPNPFRKSSTISYQLPVAHYTTLKVYDTAGKLVRVLVNSEQKSGHYTVFWDGKGDSGESVSSGTYFYRLESGSFMTTKKIVKLK